MTIENLSWQDFVRRYDRHQTFFYLDPPYYKAPYYAHNMDLPDDQDMAKILAGINTRSILSHNAHPDIRDTFHDFKIKPVELKDSAFKGKQTTGKELLITNF